MPVQDLRSISIQTCYPPQAFAFVQRGLEFTVDRIHGEPDPEGDEAESSPSSERRHVSGRALCFGLRDFALHEYGLLARVVLRRWGIQRCDDFGHIIFAMVDAGLMHKTEQDSMDDFLDLFDFADAFPQELQLQQGPLNNP